VRAVAKVIVMMGCIGARNELTGDGCSKHCCRVGHGAGEKAVHNIEPTTRPANSALYVCMSPLCMSACLPSLRFPHLPSHPMSPNQTSTPLRPPAHTSCHQHCALCIDIIVWSSLDLFRLAPRPPDYTHISTTTLYGSCRRRPHDLHLYRRSSRVRLIKRIFNI
jgi:hypothetical protein